mmetsp:Transcript_51487/g.122606  ORF Transcript_51487/g.122606 Transcript_51487/m.122606 type:complete len:242 (+) Transcript_51487:273-998(+)
MAVREGRSEPVGERAGHRRRRARKRGEQQRAESRVPENHAAAARELLEPSCVQHVRAPDEAAREQRVSRGDGGAARPLRPRHAPFHPPGAVRASADLAADGAGLDLGFGIRGDPLAPPVLPPNCHAGGDGGGDEREDPDLPRGRHRAGDARLAERGAGGYRGGAGARAGGERRRGILADRGGERSAIGRALYPAGAAAPGAGLPGLPCSPPVDARPDHVYHGARAMPGVQREHHRAVRGGQ